MGNPPDANLPAFALDTLDTWSVRHHLHESVSQRALSLSLFLPTLLPPILFLSHVRQNRRPRLAHEYARHANSPPTQSLFSFLSEGTGHRDVSRCGCAPTCCRSRDREAARGRVGSFRTAPIGIPSRAETDARIRMRTQIHLFGEGKVCQSDTYKVDPQTGIARLQRFKWGMCVTSF